jgi:hypothetical protein
MKLFSTFLILCLTSMLVAQIPKGKIMSEVGFNFSQNDFKYNFSPNAGAGSTTFNYVAFNIYSANRYFIKSNVYTSLGLGYSYSLSKQQGLNENETEGYNVSIGIGALRSLGSKFYVSADINLGIGRDYKQLFDNKPVILREYNLEYFLKLKPQLYYHLKPKFLIFVDFGQAEYSYSSNKSSYGSYSFDSDFNIFFSPRFWNYGFIFLWGKSKEKTTQN